ncbi:MAG: 4-phosphoerythronate dehydrogenase [Nitrospirae bacterium]|nr:MAG: 4-phosphoerythronate dehydrogenase [Nitrospirota bacterium]
MIILADEQIPYVQEAFSTIGIVRRFPGRCLTRAVIQEADILLVRTITPVTGTLLEGSRVRFVGTATAGVDHVDLHYLRAHHIGFASAAGANANSVAEYVMAALLVLAHRHRLTLSGKRIGIVGAGRIGSLVAHKAQALGLIPIFNDPPLARATGDIRYRPLDEVLDSEIVTLHVPLTKEEPFATYHLFNGQRLALLKPSTIFLNTARGAVVDNLALSHQLRLRAIGPTVLDVWEHEPHLHWDLVQRVDLGTPHIAGYSLEGKAQATLLLYQAVCRYFGLPEQWYPSASLPPPMIPFLDIDAGGQSDEEVLYSIVTQIYRPEHDHARLTTLLSLSADARAQGFESVRAQYPMRREFHHTRVRVRRGTSTLIEKIRGIGFTVEEGQAPDSGARPM